MALAKAAKVFNIPTTITTVETEGFSGPTYPELLAVFPEHKLLERSSMNSWDDQNVRDALAASGLQGNQVGIFGKRVAMDTRLADGDRVEIYRPLKLDPKEARRRRARR